MIEVIAFRVSPSLVYKSSHHDTHTHTPTVPTSCNTHSIFAAQFLQTKRKTYICTELCVLKHSLAFACVFWLDLVFSVGHDTTTHCAISTLSSYTGRTSCSWSVSSYTVYRITAQARHKRLSFIYVARASRQSWAKIMLF